MSFDAKASVPIRKPGNALRAPGFQLFFHNLPGSPLEKNAEKRPPSICYTWVFGGVAQLARARVS